MELKLVGIDVMFRDLSIGAIFMEIEKQRGISVSTSVMAFEYSGKKINILDTRRRGASPSNFATTVGRRVAYS